MGSGTIHMPALPFPRPLRVSMTSPTRKPSRYDVTKTSVMTSEDTQKPQLLKKVVKAEELRDIVARLSRPTTSSRMKSSRVKPKVDYVDMGYYHWSRLDVYADYQRQIYSKTGTVKPTFRKCGGQRTLGRFYV